MEWFHSIFCIFFCEDNRKCPREKVSHGEAGKCGFQTENITIKPHKKILNYSARYVELSRTISIRYKPSRVIQSHTCGLCDKCASIKALANEDTLLRTHCCRHKCFPVCPGAQHCWGHKFCVRNKCFLVCAAQETSWATMCPQQCVLVYQGL